MSEQKITISDLPELTGTVEDGYMLPIDDGEITKKVSVGHFEEAASATARQYAEAAADSATAAAGSAHDAEQIATEIAGDIAAATQAANDARGAAARAIGSASSAAASVVEAKRSASSASTSANSASLSATDASGYKDDAQAAANRAASWADYPGQTGSGDATHNAHYYADQAAAAIVGVASWNGRSGNVVPEDDDYDIDMMRDVTILNPLNDQFLQYDSETRRWKNKSVNLSGKMDIDGSNAAEHVRFNGAFAVGRSSESSGTNSVAEGNNCMAIGNYSHAEGNNSNAFGYCSHAEGASGSFNECSHSEGYGSDSLGDYTHTEGYFSYANGESSHSEGGYFDNTGIEDVTSGVYLYANVTSSSNQISVYASSDKLANYHHRCVKIKIGGKTADGYLVTRTKITSTNYRYLIRLFSSWGSSSYSAGREVDKISLGYYNAAQGVASHAEGGSNLAHGEYAHAEGYRNASFGDYSHAEGARTSASGDYSHAEGSDTNATGMNSHAEGDATKAGHDYSHAEGQGTKTGKSHQHVQGKHNIGRANTLFEIGNGTADNARHNVFEVYEDGRVGINNPEPEEYTFHISSTAASTAVAWCNKVAKFAAPNQASVGNDFVFYITVKVGDTLTALAFDNATAITSIYLYDCATAKVSNLASTNYTYTEAIDADNNIVFTFTVKAAYITTDAIAKTFNDVIDSKSPGFSCVYALNTVNLTGTIKGKGISEAIPGLSSAFNTLPVFDKITQHIGDFYFPTGGPRWNIDVEVDPGTAYMAVCYLENTTTGAYFNHSICYAGVGVPTIAAPTVAPAPVAGKTITFVGTTWLPFVAGVAGVVTDGVVTTKPRLRIQGYHSSNTPTAGLGMHMRLFRIY